MEYDLYGVVQHSGSLQGGHYVAYVKYTKDRYFKDVDRVEEDGGESGYSNAVTKAVESYGSRTAEGMDGGEGGFPSTAKGADKYGHHYQAEAYEMVELGYQISDENANKRPELGVQKEDIWCYTSDSYVSLSNEADVHDSQAYLLLYVQRN